MSPRVLLLSSVTLFSLSAFAGGFDYSSMISDGVYRGDRNCNHNSQVDDLRACIQKVNIIGPVDGRQNLAAAAKDLGIANDADRIRAMTGVVVCPNPDPKKDALVSSASIVGDGSYVLTAAHEFFLKDKSGKKTAIDLRYLTCFFQNEAGDAQQAILEFNSPSSKFGTTGKNGYISDRDPLDFAVIKLNKVIVGGRPFSIYSTPLQVDDQFIAVAGFQDGIKFAHGEPIVQQASIHDVIMPGKKGDPVSYYTDADELPAASGGSIYVRVNGELQLSGIITGSGGPEKNGNDYSFKDGSYTKILGIQGKLQRLLSDLPTSNPN